ncbi:M23 family metallopeptidase [Paenibacillus aquistagni]|uniref:M23 family metallopeptidase n=1 Tax=Paenibacillus aquistagni TaxID=1852522 RepID=UPI000B510FD3|nr:M23 family metallopeptidase [Paenibacillus aquistagni]
MKKDIRKRRQERIRELMMGQAPEHAEERWKGTKYSYQSDRSIEMPKPADDPWNSEPRIHVEPLGERGFQVSGLDGVGMEAWPSDETGKFERSQLDDPEQAWKTSRASWEERYGWSDKPDKPGKPVAPRWLRTLKWQLAGALILGIAAVASVQLTTPWQAKANAFLSASLTENMNLEPIAVWYRETFGGSPAFIPIWGSHAQDTKEVQAASKLTPPIAGQVVQSFAVNMNGIELAPTGADRLVRSAATGRVIKVGLDDKEHMTVTIQHADGYYTVYGHLASTEVSKDDWVEAGTELGTLYEDSTTDQEKTLYFAVMKNGQYVDPVDVMDLD